MADVLRTIVLTMLLAWGGPSAMAREAPLAAANPQLEARMLHITAELRCLVCQNQTIADSHSGLAEDLRRQVLEQLSAGKTDQDVLDYMTARYGDFVMYRPPFKATTALLWVGPGILMLAALIGLFFVLRRRSRLPDEAFEADENP